MKSGELFNYLRSRKYKRIGKDLDYTIEIDDVNQEINVFFQESTSVWDWIFNFLFPIFPKIINGNIYNFSVGWWWQYCSGRQIVIHDLISKALLFKDYKFNFYGYSLGGVMAQICGIDFYHATGIKSSLCTFGSPKCLFGFWSWLNARKCFNNITQYAHHSDLVTWLIPFGFYPIKNTRIGKFNFKDFFNVLKTHLSYSDETLYDK